jgi:predicted ATPase
MTLAAEMIVPARVTDDFGRGAFATTTYLRYEVELEYQGGAEVSALQPGRVVLVREQLRHINRSEAATRLAWPHSKKKFRDQVITGRRSGTAYISTALDDRGNGVVSVHQDGGSRGKARTSPAAGAPRTVVSTTTTSDDPTILAARREMQQWRMLALEPTAMRAPDSAADSSRIDSNGAHLAAALYRLGAGSADDVYARVAADAAALTDVREVNVDFDPRRELLTLEARLGRGALLPARALSDGTLRFLALCIIGLDADFARIICMEEPENGIHPGRMEAMVDLVRELAVDPSEPPDDLANPLRQVIVNTHSPYFVALQNKDDLMLAVPADIKRGPGEQTCTTVRLLPLANSWRDQHSLPTTTIPGIVEYLRRPPGAQLTLEFDGDEADLE